MSVPKAKKGDRFEQAMAKVRPALDAPESPDARPLLLEALQKAPARVAAKVAKTIRDRSINGFAQALKECFARFLKDPVKTDPGCVAKLALLEALDFDEEDDADLFVQALSYRQEEPAWGKPDDTATGVRARAAFALARLRHQDFLPLMAELLHDPEGPVRIAAIEALEHRGDPAGAALAHFKLRLGDVDPVVTAACMTTLLALAPEWGVKTLAPLLSGDSDDMKDMATVALGSSRREEAVDALLVAMASQVIASSRRRFLGGLALHRSEKAFDALLKVIAEGPVEDARAAIAAVGKHRSDTGAAERVKKAAQRKELADAIAQAFKRTA